MNPIALHLRRTAAVAGLLLVFAPSAAPALEEVREFLSPVYTIDRLYRSMKGPKATQEIDLSEGSAPELLWLTGFSVEMVGEDGTTPMPAEFMCHANLDFDSRRHREVFGWQKTVSNRLFTLSEGSDRIEFAPGFGIPVLSTEPLELATEVLNHNFEDQVFRVRHKVTVRFVRNGEETKNFKPLFMKAANALVALGGAGLHYGGLNSDPPPSIGTPASRRVLKDAFGNRFSGHWSVPPGEQTVATNVTLYMRLPFDTTAHFVSVHVHPFSRSLELMDLTNESVIFSSRMGQAEGRIGLESIEFLSSVEGVPLRVGDQYLLTSRYDNPTVENYDAMAVMYLYLLDREFDPEIPLSANALEPRFDDSTGDRP